MFARPRPLPALKRAVIHNVGTHPPHVSAPRRHAQAFSRRAFSSRASKGLEKTKSRRAMLYVPGSSEKMLRKSLDSKADALCYDLEDSVAGHRKGAARQMVLDALKAAAPGQHEKLVRINSLPTGLAADDLEVIAPCSRLNGVVVPKVQSATDVQYVAAALDALGHPETKSGVRIIASIESALAVMNLKEIATASPRVDALLFAAEDYCADVGIQRSGTRQEMLYARGAIVTAAKAYGLQAIDLVCINYKDDTTLREECEEGHRYGFDGKQAIHPSQVDAIQSLFVPSEKDIQHAADVLVQYEAASKGGRGAFGAGGLMIDAPMVLQAQSVVAKAKAAGLAIPAGRMPEE